MSKVKDFSTVKPTDGRQKRKVNESGFTVIELIVVVGIMSMFLGLIIIDIAGKRTPRNLKIAQNELISNIRKIQSYTLSSRNVSGNQAANYYVMKFDLAKPEQYTLQAMYNVSSAPQLRDIETIKLPKGIRFSQSNPVSITRSTIPNPQNSTSCVLIAFKLPFAKTFLAGFDTPCILSSGTNSITSGDNHYQILNFVYNTPNYPVSVDSSMVVRLTDENNTQPREKSFN